MILITGGSGSGKSEYAENLLKACERKLYIATMEPYGREARMRIERHQKLRESKGFETLECPRNLLGALAEETAMVTERGILLECMSNLVANEFYQADGSMNQSEFVEQKIIRGIKLLDNLAEKLVVVTNEVCSDINGYTRETMEYQKLLGKINQILAGMADEVFEVVYGIPVRIK